MKIDQIKIDQLTPYRNNPRKNDQAVEYVKNSIQSFGFRIPVIIDKNNEIICGHTRIKAAKELGLEEVPAIRAEDLTEEQVKAFRLADNKVSEFAEWDLEALEMELSDISELDMSDFGFFEEEEKEDLQAEEDNYTEPDKVPQRVSEGQIWILGRHRLMCGDSTLAADVQKLTKGQKIDLVFTDPPYGMGKETDGVENDNLYDDRLLEFNKKWIPLTFETLKDNGSWYCWGIDEPLMDIYSNILKPMIKANRITFRNLITWDKGSAQGQNWEGERSYAEATEKCLFVMCGVQGFNNNSENYYEGWEPIRSYLAGEAEKAGLTATELKKITGVGMYSHWFTKSQWNLIPEKHYKKIQAHYSDAFKKEYDTFKKEYDTFKKEYDTIKKEWYKTRAYFDNTHDNMNNVWHFERAGAEERTDHATPKPLKLCARAVKSSSREEETVLDVFGGSGSTLIACEQLNRTCYMMELTPHYCDVIIDRWEKLTGQKAYEEEDMGEKDSGSL